MQSLWSDAEAAKYQGALGLRVYTSRLLGRDKTLVLHGGGNTSVKLRQKNLFGEDEDVLYVKGSGWDLETIEPAGFTPVVRVEMIGQEGWGKSTGPARPRGRCQPRRTNRPRRRIIRSSMARGTPSR